MLKLRAGPEDDAAASVPVVNSPSRLDEIVEGSPIGLGYLMAYMTNNYLGPVYKLVESRYKLTSPEFLSLMCIARVPGINAIDISRSSGRPRNSISRAVNLLLDKNLITVEADLVDKRRKRLVVTTQGGKLYTKIEHMFEERHSHMLSVLDGREIERMEALLRKLAFRADSWAKPY